MILGCLVLITISRRSRPNVFHLTTSNRDSFAVKFFGNFITSKLLQNFVHELVLKFFALFKQIFANKIHVLWEINCPKFFQTHVVWYVTTVPEFVVLNSEAFWEIYFCKAVAAIKGKFLDCPQLVSLCKYDFFQAHTSAKCVFLNCCDILRNYYPFYAGLAEASRSDIFQSAIRRKRNAL